MGNKETSRFTTVCPVEKASERTDRRPTVCASHLREALPFASGFVTRGRGVTLFPLQFRMRGSDMGPGLVQVPGRPGVGFLTGLCLELVIFLSPLNYCSWLRDLSGIQSGNIAFQCISPCRLACFQQNPYISGNAEPEGETDSFVGT